MPRAEATVPLALQLDVPSPCWRGAAQVVRPMTESLSNADERKGWIDQPWNLFRIRFAAALAILVPSVIGIGFIDVHSQWAFRFWVGLTIFCGIVCAMLGAVRTRGKGFDFGSAIRQVVHWSGTLFAMWILFYLYDIDFVQAQGVAVFAVMLLTMSSWLAGAHFDWFFLVIGALLGLVAWGNAVVEQYLVVIVLPIFGILAALFLLQRWRLRR